MALWADQKVKHKKALTLCPVTDVIKIEAYHVLLPDYGQLWSFITALIINRQLLYSGFINLMVAL